MRAFWLICISFLDVGLAYAEPTPLVVQLRLNGQSVDAMAWRDDNGALSVDADALHQLGFATPMPAGATLLSAIPGLTYAYDPAQGAVDLTCTAACYASHVIDDANARTPLATRQSGGFLNLDLAATATSDASDAAGLFELGLFNRAGAGTASWTAGAQNGALIRLETQWTIDRPAQHNSMRLGDSFTRGGATGVPFRFGGIQLATDFSLDPNFTPYPTPTLHGEAAAPSTVDLYVDGALRLRSNVDAGPFSIPDAPVLTGAGIAHVVVTDALGRQQEYAQPFYASPTMLRAGLADYSFALGAEREDFTLASNAYGRGFASGVYRYGVTNWLTAEARTEAANDLTSLAAAASVATPLFGQIDLAYAQSSGAHDGEAFHLSWQRQATALSLGLDITGASRDFRRLGEDWSEPPPRLQTAAAIGLDLDRLGSASLAYTYRDERDAPNLQTIALSYAPPTPDGRGQLNLTALYIDDDTAPYFTVGLGYALAFDNGVSAGASAESRDGGPSLAANASRGPDPQGGFGWRAGASTGAIARIDGALLHLGAHDESALEFSHTTNGDGLRGRLAIGIAWIGGRVIASRPIRDSFALVDVGAPYVTVLRERQPIGRTDEHGTILLTGLRAYEANRIGIVLDDLPLDAQPGADEAEVAPAQRAGVVVRFPTTRGAFGQVRVIDATGASLPAGTILTRESDGARFPIGVDGQIYVAGLEQPETFALADTCTLTIEPDDLHAGRALRCAS